MTEKELEEQIDAVIAKYNANPEGFKFKERAEKQLANLLREDTKPEDIEAIKHIMDSYPDFDSVRINIGDNKNLSINFFLNCNSIKSDPGLKKDLIKTLLNMTK